MGFCFGIWAFNEQGVSVFFEGSKAASQNAVKLKTPFCLFKASVTLRKVTVVISIHVTASLMREGRIFATCSDVRRIVGY